MGDIHSDSLKTSITRHIRGSRRKVTIMFTDVEASTKYWDRHGDVKGRLMLDLHNRLVHPVIRRYGGRVVKKIGDAVMACFKSPRHALKAAIGIQQTLDKYQKEQKGGLPRVRIGIHTGKAIVEPDDVFGDMVNVASRVEQHGKGYDICVSGSAASKVSRSAFKLTRQGTFKPKGKRNEIVVYKCRWREYPSLVEDIEDHGSLSLVAPQRTELLVYTLATLGVLAFGVFGYLRYVLADFEAVALLLLDPRTPWLAAVLAAEGMILAAAAWLILMRKHPNLACGLLKGGFGFAFGFAVLLFVGGRVAPRLGLSPDYPLYRSANIFVDVRDPDGPVYPVPSEGAPTIGRAGPSRTFLLAGMCTSEGTSWFRVKLARNRFGWIQETVPPRMGVPAKRLSSLRRFSVSVTDVIALLAGALGFVWGMVTFKIRPT